MTGIPQDTQVQQCIDDCMHCYRTCQQMAMVHCLEEGGAHAEQAHMALMLNCAQLCVTTASFMLSASTLHSEVCALCAKVCGACARSCSQLDGMDDCVAACERCARSCAAVSGVGAPGPHGSAASPDTGVRGGPARQGI